MHAPHFKWDIFRRMLYMRSESNTCRCCKKPRLHRSSLSRGPVAVVSVAFKFFCRIPLQPRNDAGTPAELPRQMWSSEEAFAAPHLKEHGIYSKVLI